MANKEDIRPIYSELQGYLSQAPEEAKIRLIDDDNLWNQANQAIDELSRISGEDYNRFKITPRRIRSSARLVADVGTYRAKLGGLISRLHGKYFSDEPAPFSGMPSTVNIQTQQQSQSVHIQMLLDFQGKIDAQLQKLEPGDKKRSFLEKVKGALASVRDYAGLIALYVTTAQEFGLTLKELSELFK
ncbi:MAG TPA: hypothetical protein VMW72_05545 [Sedimentisphaerales bacterium]|nr:hypothetical protein [Sedimentisphaerales bacterium]